MKFPSGVGNTDSVVNLEEDIGKFVGTARPVPPQERYAQLLQLRRSLVGNMTHLPQGVYRFKTHEEADEWEMKQMVKRASR